MFTTRATVRERGPISEIELNGSTEEEFIPRGQARSTCLPSANCEVALARSFLIVVYIYVDFHSGKRYEPSRGSAYLNIA